MNNLFLTIKELSNEEIEGLNSEFNLALSNPAAREELTNALDKNLRGSSVRDDYKFRMSYFRWYTDLVWRRLTVFPTDSLVAVTIGRQVPMAIILDFDVVQEIILYLNAKMGDEDEMANMFSKMKTAFLASEAILGMWKDKEITVAEIVKEFFSIKQRGDDALELAEFNSKLKQILFSKNDPLVSKYIFADPDTAIYRFIQLILFFYLLEPKDIWYAVDAFMHPQGVTTAPAETASVATATVVAAGAAAAKVAMPTKREEVPAPEEGIATSPRVLGTPRNDNVKPASALKPTATEIKKIIEAQFKKDAAGQFVDVEGVFAKLGELAEKYHDPKIAELIYFDENSGEFKWNV